MTINSWGSQDPAEVAKGGTGNATLTDHGIMLGSGTAAVTVTSAPTNGQLLIGNTGSDPSVAAPTGDTNEIAIGLGLGTLSIGIADNPVMPGSESMTIPDGVTGDQPSAVNGMMRYDTTTNKLRAVENSTWVDVITSGGGSGSLIFLNRQTVSGASTVVWDSTYLTSTYAKYMVYYYDLQAAGSSAAALMLRLSNDDGMSFHATGYVGQAPASAVTTTNIPINANIGVATNNGTCSGFFTMYSPLSSGVRTQVVNTYGVRQTTASVLTGTSYGLYDTAEANNAMEFSLSTSTMSGIFELYGVLPA